MVEGRRTARRLGIARGGALLAIAVLASGCGRGRARPGMNLSSESSDYSPVARLAVALEPAPVEGDSTAVPAVPRGLVVRVDSGTIEAPGTPRPGAPAIMHALEMRALLVRFDASHVEHVGGDSDASGGAERPWTALAASEPQPVLDSLHYGERLPIAPLRFRLPPPDSAAPRRATGIVFEITASAVSEPVQMADGTVLPGRVFPRAVRVYACSAFDADGRRDRRRERALARRYTAVC